MTPNSGRAIEVFTEAIQLPTEARAAFLDRACADDGELRRKIEALLRSNDRAGAFLEAPPATAIGEGRAKAVTGERPGDRIDCYKLLEQIGEGGCGVVFLAEQEEPVRRQVALKVVKPGMDTKSVIARFEAERQALALMEHPNIARVLDAGATQRGRPYFVMEFVQGVKITDYCDEHSLSTRARLELFVQVCDAIQHAHQKGIIHRDIKPSNILVTVGPEGKPVSKVIDFGIAKATAGQRLTDKTIFTAADMLIGTPAYMSPEQVDLASVDVDTRTDIYSLGVLLYELLTGTTPFDTRELLKAGLDEVRRVIRDQEPVRPSTRLSTMIIANLAKVPRHNEDESLNLVREMRGDLDWMVMKALEKDRARRYATGNDFAMDVRRFLGGEAILARPPSTWYQLRKLAQRNRLLFGALSIVVAVFVIGFIAVAVAFTQEKAARSEAESSRRRAETDKISSQQATRFLEEMLDGVGPSVAQGRDTAILKEILDKTARRLELELTNQPAIQADLRTRLGKVYSDIGRFQESEAILRQALETRSKLFSDESEATSDTMFELGAVLSRQSRDSEAETYLQQALAARQKLFGEKSLKVSECYDELGGTFFGRQQWTQAEELVRKSFDIDCELRGENSPGLGESRVSLGSVLFAQGKYRDAEAMFRQAITNWQTVSNENDPSMIRCVNNLAAVLTVQNKNPEAEDLLRHAVRTRQKLYPDGHPSVIVSLHSLTRLLIRLHRLEEAEATGREALAVARKVRGDTDQDVLDVLQDLIKVLLQQHKFEEVEPLFADLLPSSWEGKPEYAGLLLARCEAYARCGRWREAAADATVLIEHAPDNHENYHALAPLLVQVGDLGEYQRLCRAILSKFGGATNVVVADRMGKDCLILPSSGVDPKMVAALADVAVNHGSNASISSYFTFCKGLAEFRLGRYQEAVDWCRRAVQGTFEHPKGCAFAVMAMSQFKLNRLEEARTALSKCNKIIEEKLPKAEQDLEPEWRDWIIAHALQSEAKRMIGDASSAQSAANMPL